MLLAQVSSLHPPLLTLDMLRASRIVKALRFIIAPSSEDKGQGRWPTDSFIQAKKILRRWEQEFGDLGDLRVDLFAVAHRLHGLSAARAHKITHRSVIVPDEVSLLPSAARALLKVVKLFYWNESDMCVQVIGTIWSLPHPPSTLPTLLPGQKSLAPGAWHLNLASLFHANLISHPSLGPITFDCDRAYAVVLSSPSSPPIASPEKLSPKQMRETPAWDTGAQVKFTLGGVGGLSVGAVRLIKTMKESEEGRMSVRVWRHCNWGGEWAPRGGVRYDGM